MSIIYTLLIVVAVYIIFLSPIQKYLYKREEEKLITRVENRINSMSQEERLSILVQEKLRK